MTPLFRPPAERLPVLGDHCLAFGRCLINVMPRTLLRVRLQSQGQNPGKHQHTQKEEATHKKRYNVRGRRNMTENSSNNNTGSDCISCSSSTCTLPTGTLLEYDMPVPALGPLHIPFPFARNALSPHNTMVYSFPSFQPLLKSSPQGYLRQWSHV